MFIDLFIVEVGQASEVCAIFRDGVRIFGGLEAKFDGAAVPPQPETATQPVPDREDTPIIAVGLDLPSGVVDPVHGRGHQYRPHHPVDLLRKPDIAVVK